MHPGKYPGQTRTYIYIPVNHVIRQQYLTTLGNPCCLYMLYRMLKDDVFTCIHVCEYLASVSTSHDMDSIRTMATKIMSTIHYRRLYLLSSGIRCMFGDYICIDFCNSNAVSVLNVPMYNTHKENGGLAAVPRIPSKRGTLFLLP